MSIFSSKAQLERIAKLVSSFTSLPFAPRDSVPGAVLMAVLADVRDAVTLETYDFVDVVRSQAGIGWQVKSTKSATPVTWKRAKIPNKDALIAASATAKGAQDLGNAIIEFCNDHAVESMKLYGLDEIGIARLIVYPDLKATYYERSLVTKSNPHLFDPKQFTWKWSAEKKVKKKEQLSSLHGIHVPTGKKWWAWHGRGENQLHFSGEGAWWPKDTTHAVNFSLPSLVDRLSMQDLIGLLDT